MSNWGGANRPITSNKLGAPSPRDGADGDMQVRQTNLGAKIFAKIGGAWYDSPLSMEGVTRIGASLSDHLSIDNDSVDIFKNKVKVASFGETTTLGNTSTEHVEITSSHFKIKDGSTARVTIDSTGVTVPNVLLTGKIELTSSEDRNICIGVNNTDAGADNIGIGVEAGNDYAPGSNSNISIGSYAGDAITDGDFNICIGHQAGTDITTAQGNVCLGYQSGFALTTTGNVANTPARNTLLGNRAGESITTGNSNLCLGALANVDDAGAVNRIAIGCAIGTATAGSLSRVTVNDDNTTVIGNAEMANIYMSQDGGATVHCGAINSLTSITTSMLSVVDTSNSTPSSIGEVDLHSTMSIKPRGDTDCLLFFTNAGTSKLPAIQGSTAAGSEKHILLQPLGGRVGLGINDPSAFLHMVGNLTSAGNTGGFGMVIENHAANSYQAKGILVKCGNDGTDARGLMIVNAGNEECGWINGDGNAQEIELEDASDIRLKENIEDSTYDALSKINSLKIRKFDWKKNKKHRKIGLVAQEVMEVDSDFVNNADLDKFGIKKTKFIFPLLKAIQQLSAKIDTMQAEINNLKG